MRGNLFDGINDDSRNILGGIQYWFGFLVAT
jgi:hypothetical protein